MRWLTISALALVAALPIPGRAQDEGLRGSLEQVFSDVLELELAGPGNHGDHFKPSNVGASASIIEGLGNFISASAASFPLSSTTAGVVFDFSSGVPVAATTSAGPIFAENATTLGKGSLTFGGTLSHLNLDRLRGVKTEDMVFAFTHQDIADPGLGDVRTERDYIELAMDLDVAATVAAFQATYGLTDRIDIGIAIPYVNVSMSGDPIARMNSYTFASTDTAFHYFEGGTSTEPILALHTTPLDESASGIGDIALRGKVHVYSGARGDVAFLAEARLPTGDEENFLGAGSVSAKAMFITSGQWGRLNPHLNAAYERNGSDWVRDQFELTWGFDQKATDELTIVVEWAGEFELGDEIESFTFPERTPIGSYEGPDGNPYATQYVNPSNVPNRSNDNIMNSALGVKYTPRPNVTLIANVIFPLNDGGLRSTFIPTVGFSYAL
jgi:hypothetical protein